MEKIIIEEYNFIDLCKNMVIAHYNSHVKLPEESNISRYDICITEYCEDISSTKYAKLKVDRNPSIIYKVAQNKKQDGSYEIVSGITYKSGK